MLYVKRTVSFLEVKELSPQDLYNLGEFLRLKMITPVNRSEGVNESRNGEERTAFFSGGFTEKDSLLIQGWLEERGAVCQERKE